MRKILALFIGIWICQLNVTQAVAQNVTISPTTGKLVAGLTYEGELGFERGWSSLWRHEQLPLTLTVSDKGDISESGVLTDPAGDIILDTSQGKYVVVSGQPRPLQNLTHPLSFLFLSTIGSPAVNIFDF